MRKFIIAGNWKMNTNLQEGLNLAQKVTETLKEMEYDTDKFGLIVAPPYTHLYAIRQLIDEKIEVSSQNIAHWEKGAYTGEISADMLISAGANYSIIGHSERRKYFKEDNEILTEKLKLALKNDVKPIFCIGEQLSEREQQKHFNVVENQINETLFSLSEKDFAKIIIAYEPVWAIGTGKTATPEQAQQIHSFIRKKISGKYNNQIAQNTTILYGGSCKPKNADGLFSQSDIDGGLIGGASLKANDFIELLKILIKHK